MTAPRILSLDLGMTTGWALIDPSFVQTGNIVYVEPGKRFPQNHLHNALNSLKAKYGPTQVIIERMPLRLKPELRTIVSTAENLFPQHHKIGPGEWKPVASKVRMPFSPTSQHEKDAFRMGRFYLYKFWQVPLGDE